MLLHATSRDAPPAPGALGILPQTLELADLGFRSMRAPAQPLLPEVGEGGGITGLGCLLPEVGEGGGDNRTRVLTILSPSSNYTVSTRQAMPCIALPTLPPVRRDSQAWVFLALELTVKQSTPPVNYM